MSLKEREKDPNTGTEKFDKKAYKRKWQQDNKESVNKRCRKWYYENKESRAEYRKKTKEHKKAYDKKRYQEKKAEKLAYVNNYRKTKEGLLSKIYNHQKDSSKRRKHPEPVYTLEKLREEYLEDVVFNELFEEWIKSNYDIKCTPSLDRIDSSKPYTFNNLQWVTWEINNKNGVKEMCKPVVQYDLDGNLIQEFPSATAAARELNYNRSCISSCALGTQKTAYGFIWRFTC